MHACFTSNADVIELRGTGRATAIGVALADFEERLKPQWSEDLSINTVVVEGCVVRPLLRRIVEPAQPDRSTETNASRDLMPHVENALAVRFNPSKIQSREAVVRIAIGGGDGVVINEIPVGKLLEETCAYCGLAGRRRIKSLSAVVGSGSADDSHVRIE